jgi:hypothetical protein
MSCSEPDGTVRNSEIYLKVGRYPDSFDVELAADWAACSVAHQVVHRHKALAMPPIPGRCERATLDANVRGVRAGLLCDNGGRVLPGGERPALRHQPGVQMLAAARQTATMRP